MWNAQVLTALIAAIAALIVAIVQAFISRRNTQQIETLRSRLERQRATSSEYLRNYLQFVIDGKERELQAFKELLQCVQALRDKTRLVMGHPTSYDAKPLHQEISSLRDDILKCFGTNQAHFNETDVVAAHTLKTNCKIMADELLVYLEGLGGQPLISIPAEIGERQKEIALLQADFRARASVATKAFIKSLNPEGALEEIRK